jgi:THO complex subunit 1
VFSAISSCATHPPFGSRLGLTDLLQAQVPIDSDDFVKVWNLFDILQCLSDRGQCDPALLVWLLEDLLDSQTIPGCRKILDYLESRRQRIISKNFNEKKLVILRSCNELLRRLSRAEDTSFSGRVFIFLFQSFPLGDKSSVNLRGEYHTQNVTIYDHNAPKSEAAEDKMDIDSEPTPAKDVERAGPGKAVSFSDRKEAAAEKPLDTDALYPVFWSLQESFNQPKKLFSPTHFSQFKNSLQATMTAFKARPVQQEPKSSKQAEESKRGLKRKKSSEIDAIVDTFNPKYLTSRDLFELEVGVLEDHNYQSLLTYKTDRRLITKAIRPISGAHHHGLLIVTLSEG